MSGSRSHRAAAAASNGRRPDNRRTALLAAAARRFAQGGFVAASMRDIAQEVGMLAGSMYYHFASKDALIEELYALGVGQVTASVERALQDARGPWPRLEAACVGHLEALLAHSPFARVMTADLSHLPARLRRRLVAQRDAYEQLFVALIADLKLPDGADRRLLRLHVLGALNWTPTWYRPGGATPADIARALVRALRRR
ncbi:helix-turn-helix transcriptional regulator [Vineibacter terrae]|uniref:Helix-turn-helix transcriptional regulator n=1 Tax=Vineibacter terrae TaxID=2586908 RepID=A0A5C8PH77_9HYPH|nr:TetR/AcrR family transcriptional regulator [Vineibacter terrae]TXL73152.1 helix-turn-helix transcriptional regulator [Vineibacter terrae]